MRKNRNISCVIILIFWLAVVSCQNYTSKPIDSITQKRESFELFINKFSTDSLFQKGRIDFPVCCIIGNEEENYDTNWINKNDWRFSELYNESQKSILNKCITRRDEDQYESIFLVKGIDNGIYISYYFKLESNVWFLYKIVDDSY